MQAPPHRDGFLADLRRAVAKRDATTAIDRLRESDPVHWSDELAAWIVTRHDDVRLLFADARLTPDPRARSRPDGESDPTVRWTAENPFLGEDRARARRLVSAALTPRAVARMEHQVAEVVEQFAAPLGSRTDVVDLLAEFAAPIPGIVISRITGIPPKGTDEERFRVLARKTVRGVNPTLSTFKRESTERHTAEMFDYVRALAIERVVTPRDDLISDLLAASGGRSPEAVEEIVRVVGALVSTGTEATALAATRAIRTLLQHPDQLALLRAQRMLLPRAVEELLRWDSGLSEMPRYALETFELRGKTIAKGQVVILSLLGAHRDPRVFTFPNRLDLRRVPRDSIGFGYGEHYCIGAPLARAELRLMVAAALDFLPPHARLLEDRVRWSTKALTGRIKSLPVDFGAIPARGEP
jgi:cytochrome P450